MFSNLKALSIPQGNVIKIEANGVVLWQKAPTVKNWALCSINADGSIYNNGLGYKEGYRVRSGGVEAVHTEGVCTGFIPFKKGDILRIYPSFSGYNSTNAINFANASFTNIGQFTDSGAKYGICNTNSASYQTTKENGISTFIYNDNIDSNIAYVRVTHCFDESNGVKSGAEMIITINEEIAL